VERVYLHEKVGITLEGLYRTTDEFVTDPTIAPQLARHFQEARITDKTIGYLHLAGEKAVQLSAYQEARVHLTRAKALLKTMADTPERMDLELSIQIALGMAWMGFPGIEWENASTRALELCRLTGKTSQLCRVLGNLSIIHYVRAEHHRALELAEELLSQGLCTNDPINVALGHWQVGLVLFVLGEYAIAREHFGKVIRFYIPKEHHQPFVFLQGVDVGVSAMAYEACCQWCLGYPDLALQHSQEALALARELDHPFTLADVVSYAGCLFNHMQRDGQAFKENAEELERLSNEKVPAWLGAGMRFRGEALAMLGQVQEGITLMHNGMATCQSLGNYLDFSRTLGSLAKAQSVVGLPKQGLATLDKALAIVEDTDERLWEPELHRTRAEIQKTQGEIGAVEVSLSKAIEIAHRQNAKSWELRATTDLAHLWHEMGRSDEAREMLGEIYVWFSEGFDTRDLKEAKVLLEKLS
jgi:tetratricopeptide (TPR) repeat protein